jgi:microcystin-dependent protein
VPVLDIESYKPVAATGADANQVANGLQAIEDVVNGLDYANFKIGAAATEQIVRGKVTGDAADRFALLESGKMSWGPGSGAADTSLERSAASKLSLGSDDTLKLGSGGIEFPDATVATTAGVVPAGVIQMYGGAAAPAGYLLCDGTSYLRADYAALFTSIDTAYGSADGTHFNVPDMRGRFPVGRGTHGDCNTLGDSDGQATVGSRRPKHKHTVVQPTMGTALKTSATGSIGDVFVERNPGGAGETSFTFPDITGGTVGPQTNVPVDDAPAYLTVNYIIKV